VGVGVGVEVEVGTSTGERAIKCANWLQT